MDTCKAAVFVGPGKPLEVREFAVPEVEPGAVLVKMEMAAVCGSDVHTWHDPAAEHPVIFGHENVGAIAQLGRGVTQDPAPGHRDERGKAGARGDHELQAAVALADGVWDGELSGGSGPAE